MLASLLKRFLRTKDNRISNFLKNNFKLKTKNYDLYVQSLTHASYSVKNNVRLEFLGDSVLNTIVTEWLYYKFPEKNEGELSKLKSIIISRNLLNYISEEIKIGEILNHNLKNNFSADVYGNALEALIGAIFIDKGYNKTRKVVFTLLDNYVTEEIIEDSANYKGKILEWSQKNKKKVFFDTKFSKEQNEFICKLHIDNVEFSEGSGRKKIIAENNASKNACKKLNL